MVTINLQRQSSVCVRCLSRLLSLILLCTGVAGVAFANTQAQIHTYIVEHAKGWHWYEPIEVPLPPNPPNVWSESYKSKNDPVATLHQQSVRLKQALSQAILKPTIPHVRAYVRLQNALSEQASRFAKMWRVTLLHYPELDETVKHPTASYARQVLSEQQSKRDEQRLHALAKHAGLLFFYRSTCPYCHRFAPILKAFAKAYGFALIPITLDGKPLPEFPHSKIDHGQATHLKVNVVPAVFLYDTRTQKMNSVSYGAVSEQALKTRILQHR